MTEVYMPSPPTAPRMLIADDDPAIMHSLADCCGKIGFKVDTAINGIQLLVKARQSQPDIVIVDINMPELDGISVGMSLLDLASKRIDVVVVTGLSDPAAIQRCQALGMHFVRKGPNFWPQFEFALSEIYPAMAGKIEQEGWLASAAGVHERPRVLVIDDDPAIHAFFASRLDKFSVDTLYAADAVHGYRTACNERPSVIIADNFMPNGDAQYLLYRLRGTPATEAIPVIVISGKPLDESTAQSLRRAIGGRPGAAHIFRKSRDTDELFGALQKFCSFEKGPAH